MEQKTIIIIVIVVGVLLVGGLAAIFWYRRHKERSSDYAFTGFKKPYAPQSLRPPISRITPTHIVRKKN